MIKRNRTRWKYGFRQKGVRNMMYVSVCTLKKANKCRSLSAQWRVEEDQSRWSLHRRFKRINATTLSDSPFRVMLLMIRTKRMLWKHYPTILAINGTLQISFTRTVWGTWGRSWGHCRIAWTSCPWPFPCPFFSRHVNRTRFTVSYSYPVLQRRLYCKRFSRQLEHGLPSRSRWKMFIFRYVEYILEMQSPETFFSLAKFSSDILFTISSRRSMSSASSSIRPFILLAVWSLSGSGRWSQKESTVSGTLLKCSMPASLSIMT